MREAPTTNRNVRDSACGSFFRCRTRSPDKQGGQTIPCSLGQYAGPTKDCTVIGQGSRIEVWDTDASTTWLAEHEQALPDTPEEAVPGPRSDAARPACPLDPTLLPQLPTTLSPSALSSRRSHAILRAGPDLGMGDPHRDAPPPRPSLPKDRTPV